MSSLGHMCGLDCQTVLTITGEGHRLLRLGDLNGNLDRAASITSSIPLGDDGTQDVAGVGGEVAVREPGAQAAWTEANPEFSLNSDQGVHLYPTASE